MMSHQKAKQIFSEFQDIILAQQKKYGVVFSETSLTHSKAEMKEAMKQFVRFLHEEKKLNEVNSAEIKSAFAALGMFVSEADAEFVKAYREAIDSKVTTGAAQNNKQFQFIMNKARIQEEDNMQEFKVFYSKLMNFKQLGS